jgi:hypothetical protein
MFRNAIYISVLAGGALLLSSRAAAHHAFAAEFDNLMPVTLSGKVTKVEWLNPHARFYLAIQDPRGRVASWELELGSPNGLIRQGWTRYSIKPGDLLTVTGYRARDGSRLAAARAINFSDGRSVAVGAAGDGGPPR